MFYISAARCLRHDLLSIPLLFGLFQTWTNVWLTKRRSHTCRVKPDIKTFFRLEWYKPVLSFTSGLCRSLSSGCSAGDLRLLATRMPWATTFSWYVSKIVEANCLLLVLSSKLNFVLARPPFPCFHRNSQLFQNDTEIETEFTVKTR